VLIVPILSTASNLSRFGRVLWFSAPFFVQKKLISKLTPNF
jgi:hypothetical protein